MAFKNVIFSTISIFALTLSAADYSCDPEAFSIETSSYKDEASAYGDLEYVNIKFRNSVIFIIAKSLVPCFEKLKLSAMQQKNELRFLIGTRNILRTADQIFANFYLPGKECDLTSFAPTDITLKKTPIIGKDKASIKSREVEISRDIFDHLEGLIMSNINQKNLLLNTYFLVSPPKIYDALDLKANFKLDKGYDVSCEPAPQCCVCNNEKANYLFLDCGHLNLGDECYEKMKNNRSCPSCNQPAHRIVRTYY